MIVVHKWIVWGLSLIAPFSFADKLPDNVCYTKPCEDRSCKPFVCNQQSKDIHKSLGYLGSNLSEFEAPAVYSGQCHQRGNLEPKRPHFGGLLFDQDSSSKLVMAGAFSFYAYGNPYADLTVEQARVKWANRKPYYFKHYDNYSFMDKNPGGEDPVWYWINQVADGDNQLVQLLGFWGYNQMIFCELEKH